MGIFTKKIKAYYIFNAAQLEDIIEKNTEKSGTVANFWIWKCEGGEVWGGDK